MAGEIMLRHPHPNLRVMLRQLAAAESLSMERLAERVLMEWCEPRFRHAGFAIREGVVVPLMDVLNEPGRPELLFVNHRGGGLREDVDPNRRLSLLEQLEEGLAVTEPSREEVEEFWEGEDAIKEP